MKNSIRLLSVLVFSSLSALAATDSIKFLKGGTEVKTLSLELPPSDLKKSELKVHEPHEDRKKTYKGFRAQDLLTWAYGDAWKKSEEILFTCSDGYQPSVPSEYLQKYDALFATAVKGQKNFVVQNKMQNEKDVPLGPMYLVWNNLKHSELRADGANGWPYQIVSIDLVKFKDRFAKTSPPEGSPPAVHKGFLFFRQHCMSCHAINGEGGQKGPDLTQPENLLKKYGDEKFVGIIMNPRKYNADSKMSGFADDPNYKGRLKEVEAQLPDLLAYLKAVGK
jgi:hypothetical protein